VAKLHVYLPNRPKDDEIEVPPYGVFRNGSSYEVENLKEDLTLGNPDAQIHRIEEEPETSQISEESSLYAPVKVETRAADDQPTDDKEES